MCLGSSAFTLFASSAVAAELPTEFVLLTSRKDEATIREHPAFGRLARDCTKVASDTQDYLGEDITHDRATA